MKKVLFLSSALVMTMCSAFADDTATPDKKITGGAGTCTVDVLGVSDNNATANTIATWSLNSYECAAGQYLDETTLLCTECPTGSYCPGGTYTVESENMGKTACPTDYTSDAAATAESECYMGCELACSANAECPPHSKNCTHSAFTTTGKQYVDATCNAYPSVCPVADFQCDTGYSMQTITHADTIQWMEAMKDRLQEIANQPSIAEDDPTIAMLCDLSGQDGIPDNGINDCDFVKPGTLLFDHRYLFEFSANPYDINTPGILVGNDYPDVIQDDTNMPRPYYLLNANFQTTDTGEHLWIKFSQILTDTADTKLLEYAFANMNTAGPELLTQLENDLKPENYQKVVDFYIRVQSGAFSSIDEAQAEFNKILATTREMRNLNSVWIYSNAPKNEMAFGWTFFHPALEYIDIDLQTKYCTTNMININWNPDNGKDAIQNMCVYDGFVATPSDPVKPGYTFMGWKLVESTTTTE